MKLKKNLTFALALPPLLLLCLCFAGVSQAEEIISGRYISKTATRIVLEIIVGSPAPKNLIVTQHVPPGTAVAGASPSFRKYNKKNGEIRWLLRNVQAGSLQVQLNLQSPVSPNKVHAEIRCKNPVSQQMVTSRVR
jgi:hypothetical protein